MFQKGSTSLHCASLHGYAELCTLLLRSKADVEAKDQVHEAISGMGIRYSHRKIQLSCLPSSL